MIQSLKTLSKKTVIFCSCFLFLIGNAHAENDQNEARQWAEKLSKQIIEEFPNPVKMRKSDGGYRWSYVQGMVLLAMQQLASVETSESLAKSYQDYIQIYLDHYIAEDGRIRTLHADEFNIDSINPGKILFQAYENSQDTRYLTAMKTLRRQLEWQPRTRRGVFWHKRKYPWQIWLDGLYMQAPFYAQYNQNFDRNENTNDILLQFEESYSSLLDEKTGLLYHGFDESKTQRWADPTTGRSSGFWSRSLGWYAMALVDTLDYIDDKKQADRLLNLLRPLFHAIKQQQDDRGLWYQVTNKGGDKGNYLEASSSAMFTYAFAKAARMKYLDSSFNESAWKAYQALHKQLISVDERTGYIRLANVCRSAGLGGTPYRDGSYKYYINADIEENDAHGIGALLLALTELSR